jgi:hypothetical protein
MQLHCQEMRLYIYISRRKHENEYYVLLEGDAVGAMLRNIFPAWVAVTQAVASATSAAQPSYTASRPRKKYKLP